ncbi:hypothetical protein MLD38_024175 [Melastoma candidum]|uniref:Uncharacterized protein n=1 Tax=Melastoma candidum TaxID=119954 RepID=A0ACB9NSU3_9MYRT|nr:hypothetical protein MLD38_024175 [Melastoma candidum]
MDLHLPSVDSSLEFIDMEHELGSYILCRNSSWNQREFEFQMSTATLQREGTTSPADELFYKGKLLPLHLPPRVEMVEKLLRNSVSAYEEFYGTPTAVTAPMSTTVSTPFESCNVSPCEFRSISQELSPEVYSLEYSAGAITLKDDHPKKLWSKNIKLIKQHLFGHKLKGSQAFFKFFIGKSGCSDDSAAVNAKGSISASSRRRDVSLNRKVNVRKGDRLRRVQLKQSPVKLSPEKVSRDDGFDVLQHRRSLSLSSRWRQSNKICSSSVSSSSSSSSLFSTSLESSRLPYVETDSPIQAAIAYCKQSQNPQRVEMQPDSSRG